MLRYLLSLGLLVLGGICNAAQFKPEEYVKLRTVKVFSFSNEGGYSMGSATSLNNGFLVSASHVFSSSGPILLMAKYDSEAYPAILVASNPITDIAILKFNKGIGLPHVVIKDLSDVSIGDKGFLVGSCMGLVDFEVLPVRISAFIFQSRNPNYPWVKTIVVSSDKAICPGYSGGGLFSDKGELIGVTSQAGVLNMREVFLGYIIPLPIEFKQPLK